MNYLRSIGLSAACLSLFNGCVADVAPPEPYGALPTEHQLIWQHMQYYMFIHFGPNTFTNVEWGDGKEDPKVFNPTNLDCRQWAATAKAAGMKGIIITAKHHDGFCLWPSNFSTHTVRESPWKEGKGDLLRELSDACKEYGLKFGVYLSPWDQNHPAYGTPEYNQIFANTLNEVLTQYGEVFEQWFDGANGDAHKGKKQVYDWPLFHETVYRNQPQAIIFSDIGPGCRWMGNERGIAGETNWSTLNVEGFGPGLDAPASSVLNSGDKEGKAWVPAETDVSIRPGWFYSPSTDEKVKTVEQLTDIYYSSIGRNSNLLLNVPPNREGRIHANDSIRLMEFKQVIDESFAQDLIQGATLTASHTRGRGYKVSNLLQENYDSYWATNDGQLTASIEIHLPKAETFNRFLLQEYIPLGQRVAKFAVDVWNESTKDWELLSEGTTIGYKRILCFPQVKAQKIRLTIQEALACPVLTRIGLFKAVEFLSVPSMERNKEGEVTMRCISDDPVIYYTLDGSEPTASSIRYQAPFSLPEGGVVRAIAMIDGNRKQSEIATVRYGIAPAKWKVIAPEDQMAGRAIDGKGNTVARIPSSSPLTIDLGESLVLKGFVYTPANRTDAPNIYRYLLAVSKDNKEWSVVKPAGVFPNIQNNPIAQEVVFDQPVEARYMKLKAIELTHPGEVYTVAEIGVYTK
ncbi:hypothetical protein D0T51_05065 [Parabacteroides sp. 52]|nr:hypothetical protein [Parabacteroides sp. 52]